MCYLFNPITAIDTQILQACQNSHTAIKFTGLVTSLFKLSNRIRSQVQWTLSKDNSSYLIVVVVSLGGNVLFHEKNHRIIEYCMLLNCLYVFNSMINKHTRYHHSGTNSMKSIAIKMYHSIYQYILTAIECYIPWQ